MFSLSGAVMVSEIPLFWGFLAKLKYCRLVSLTGAVTSKKVTGVYKGIYSFYVFEFNGKMMLDCEGVFPSRDYKSVVLTR